jgi:fatty acid-binding protein DegV
MRERDEIFIPLKKSHNGNVQQNMDDVVVLAVSSSRSDPIQAPQQAAPPSDAHVRCIDVSSLLGSASMME